MIRRPLTLVLLLLLSCSRSVEDAGIVLSIDSDPTVNRTAINQLVVTVDGKKQTWILSQPLPGELGIVTSPGTKTVTVDGFMNAAELGQWSGQILAQKGQVARQTVILTCPTCAPDGGAPLVDSGGGGGSIAGRDGSVDTGSGSGGIHGAGGTVGSGGSPSTVIGSGGVPRTGGVTGTGGVTSLGGASGTGGLPSGGASGAGGGLAIDAGSDGLLLFDDFETGNANQWSPDPAADWTLATDTSTVYEQNVDVVSTGRWIISSAGERGWTDVSVEAKVKFLSTTSTTGLVSGMGVCARVLDSSNFYMAELLASGQLIIRRRNGSITSATSATVAAAISFAVSTNTWYTLKLVVIGQTLTAYVDGVLLLTGTDAYLTAGRIAVGTYVAKAAFDDVRVTKP